MNDFDSIVAAAFPSNGDGTWSAGPCKTCGSCSVLLDPTPVCIVCSSNIENARTYMEAVITSLDMLGELARKLPASEKENVRRQLDFVHLALAKVGLGAAP